MRRIRIGEQPRVALKEQTVETGEEAPEQIAVSARADGGNDADGQRQGQREPTASPQSLNESVQPFPAPGPNPKQNQNHDDDVPNM